MQLIIGKKAILDAINNKTLIKATISDKDKTFLHKVKSAIKDVEICNSKSFYDKITNFAKHQFALGYTQIKNTEDLNSFFEAIKDKISSSVLMLDSIEDPQNFGAIIRTAEALGIDAIVYKKDNQCQIVPSVIKTSAGAIANINMIKVTNLIDTINKFKEHGFWIYASCIDKNAHNLSNIKFAKKTVIIVGNENRGISPLVTKNADFKIYIELKGKTQSLNVSTATAILLYKVKN